VLVVLGNAWEAYCRPHLTLERRTKAIVDLEHLCYKVMGTALFRWTGNTSYSPAVTGGQPTIHWILHIANSQGRRAYLALLPAEERERANENATGSGVCENHFSTIAGESKGGKACSTDTIPRLAQFDVVDAIKAKEEGERGFYVRHSKRQRKDSAVRAANWNDGADSADTALRERWYRDLVTRARGYVARRKSIREENAAAGGC